MIGQAYYPFTAISELKNKSKQCLAVWLSYHFSAMSIRHVRQRCLKAFLELVYVRSFVALQGAEHLSVMKRNFTKKYYRPGIHDLRSFMTNLKEKSS